MVTIIKAELGSTDVTDIGENDNEHRHMMCHVVATQFHEAEISDHTRAYPVYGLTWAGSAEYIRRIYLLIMNFVQW